MNSNTLNDFRHEIYRCFGKAKDALFNLVDALASEAGARSFPELSLSPLFERTWASLYEALEDGQIDAQRLREIFVDFAPLPQPGEFVLSSRGHQQPVPPGGRNWGGSDADPYRQSAEEYPCGQPWVGREPCGPPAAAGRSRHLRAGHRTGRFDGTGNRSRRPPIASGGGDVGRTWAVSHHSR